MSTQELASPLPAKEQDVAEERGTSQQPKEALTQLGKTEEIREKDVNATSKDSIEAVIWEEVEEGTLVFNENDQESILGAGAHGTGTFAPFSSCESDTAESDQRNLERP